jgi:F-type H+-transporting ATPase subunit b
MTVFLAGGGGLLSFNTGFAIWVLISMIVFLIAMAKWAVPPIMKALNDREQRIQDSLDSAEKALAKAEQISKDNDKAMREAELKAQQIRKEAMNDAELLRTERIEKSKQEAAKILEDARNVIGQEKKRALKEVRNEVAELAVKAAGIILDSEIDKDKNKKLVDNYINNLSKN